MPVEGIMNNYQELDKISTVLYRVMILCQDMYEPSKQKFTEHRVPMELDYYTDRVNILPVPCKNKI